MAGSVFFMDEFDGKDGGISVGGTGFLDTVTVRIEVAFKGLDVPCVGALADGLGYDAKGEIAG